MKSDTDIKRDVEEALRLNPDVDTVDISLVVTSGVVILSGYVRSFSQRCEAGRTAKGAAGAAGVVNGIEIRLPVLNQRPDPEIARDAIAAIQIELPYSWEQVRVLVHEGWLTLEGQTELNYPKVRAEHAVRRVRGIQGLTDLIQVGPRLSSGEVNRLIQASFRRSAETGANSVASRPAAAP